MKHSKKQSQAFAWHTCHDLQSCYIRCSFFQANEQQPRLLRVLMRLYGAPWKQDTHP